MNLDKIKKEMEKIIDEKKDYLKSKERSYVTHLELAMILKVIIKEIEKLKKP